MDSPGCKVEVDVADELWRLVPDPPPAKPPDRAVVFVHGFVGDAQGTWRQKEALQSFPSLIATDPVLADHLVYIFQYKTKSLHPPAINNIADQLRYHIVQRMAGKRLVFLAHSMGGLVVMRCILRLLESSQAEPICGLLLYGSPMNGVEWVKYAQLVLELATFKIPVLSLASRLIKTNKQLSALTAGSVFVDQLNGNWILHVLNGGNPSVMTSQRAWFPVRVVSGNDDWVVKESSARGLYSQIDWINVNENHITLVKPSDRTASTYIIARDFLQDCRTWIHPKALLKLRSQLDALWSMHTGRTIADWHFTLIFQPPSTTNPTAGAFGLPNFRPFTVVECSYRRWIASKIVKFGFAVGPITASALWSDDFVFLHSIRFGALSPAVTQSLQGQLRATLAGSGDSAWSTLFDKVVIRIRHPDRPNEWYPLTPGALTLPNDGLVREFTLPQQAEFLLDQEAVVDVSFLGLLPNLINDYTMQFPWLCDGFVATITVMGSPTYLITSQGMRAAIQTQREPQAGKAEYSSDDLILPDSFLQFEWAWQ
jgi:pimeloyl-ACP methyl ester carboxylesterase